MRNSRSGEERGPLEYPFVQAMISYNTETPFKKSFSNTDAVLVQEIGPACESKKIAACVVEKERIDNILASKGFLRV